MTATPARVRFAPSPTGALHVGSVRTALFNWLVARSSGGTFILRIEDTDQGRYVPGSESQITAALTWLGLSWDEGPGVEGPRGPYVQSLRSHLYREHAERLVAAGRAYWCSCSSARLEEMRAAQRAARRPSRYDRRCLDRQHEVAAEREAGVPAVLRQLIPEGRTAWTDLVRGEVTFENADLDDQVLLKSDGFPTYHLANVVDDHLMEITVVIRAEEWIPSTPKHLLLYAALGWEPPAFAHVPVVLGTDRQKLSKRRGARSVLEYRDLGYLPAALVNAMALLGWSSPDEQEVMTPAEVAARFSIDRVQPSPAIFDERRLDALQGQHVRRLTPEELCEELRPWLPGVGDADRRALVPLLQERITRLAEAAQLTAPLLQEPLDPPPADLTPKGIDAAGAAALLDAAARDVEAGGLADPDALRERLGSVLDGRGVRRRDGFRVLYVAVLGAPAGLPVFPAMTFLGGERTLRRLRAALARLEEGDAPAGAVAGRPL